MHAFDQRRHWHRILGRLRRRLVQAMPGENVPMNPIAEQSYRRSPPPVREPPGFDPRPIGIDVYPGMDRDFPRNPPDDTVGPTDPEVFARPQRPPTPTPRQPTYDVPRMSLESVEAAITPGTIGLIDDVLAEINRESDDFSPESGSDHITLPDMSRPPPSHAEVSSTRMSEDHGYVEMSSLEAEAGSSRGPPASPISPTDRGSFPRNPSSAYDNVSEPSYRHHIIGERAIPVPQRSPPPIRPPMPVPTPVYYRDYANPYARGAYKLICHSAWFVQAGELSLCPECATSEHTFCIQNRVNAAWRQVHIISRTFVHTDLHCGRCYKLLMRTRRAIDCFTCRMMIIEMQGRTAHLTYRILCEAIIPRGPF